MKILIACEFSGIVREAFKIRGHDAWSCDLLPTEIPGQHIQDDVLNHLYGWDMMIAHPPCTNLAVSGARWFKEKRYEQYIDIGFYMTLWESKINKICIENPVGIMTKYAGKPQYIKPGWFGEPYLKKTGLLLKNLPELKPVTNIPDNECYPAVHYASPGINRWKERSRTYPGIAKAMAEQWG